jgi:hypothetical protein
MENESKEVEANTDQAGRLDGVVIFRCGWCGWPCNEDGSCMEISNDAADAYLKEHESSEVECVNGACCPNGDN